MKFYEARKDVEPIFIKGDQYVSWDNERLYSVKSSVKSQYLSINALNHFGGIKKYFKLIKSVDAPFLLELKKREEGAIIKEIELLLSWKKRLATRRRFIRAVEKLLINQQRFGSISDLH